jgi:hypothetical protein
MAEKTPDPHETVTHDSNAGAPANPAIRQPTEDELDQREREKAQPRRAAGPSLVDTGGDEASRNALQHEPPPTTDPVAEVSGADEYGAAAQTGSPTETHATDAGHPAEFAGPKPSEDELDRRDRLKAAPRRVAGPPLRDDESSAARDAVAHEPPAPTDPQE